MFGRHLVYGVIGGAPLTSDFNSLYEPLLVTEVVTVTPEKRGFRIGGGSIRWSFSSHLSLSRLVVSRIALRQGGNRPADCSQPCCDLGVPRIGKIPIQRLLAGRKGDSAICGAGASFRTAGNLNEANPSHAGISAGAGIELNVHGFNVAPTMRYTRWRSDARNLIASRPHQLELLVGFSRGGVSDHPLGSRFTFGVMAGTNLLGDYPVKSMTTTVSRVVFPGLPPATTTDTISIGGGPHSFFIGPSVEMRLTDHLSPFPASMWPVPLPQLSSVRNRRPAANSIHSGPAHCYRAAISHSAKRMRH